MNENTSEKDLFIISEYKESKNKIIVWSTISIILLISSYLLFKSHPLISLCVLSLFAFTIYLISTNYRQKEAFYNEIMGRKW